MRSRLVGYLPAISAFLLFPPNLAVSADEIRAVPGAVEELRSNTPDIAGLSLELKLEGEGSADVDSIRLQVKSAKDNLGNSLYRALPKQKRSDFEPLAQGPFPPKIRLANPPRDATTMNVSIEVDLFIPKRDPGSRVKLGAFLAKLDKPLSNSALKSAKVEITPLSAKEYQERMARSRPTKEQLMARAKEDGLSEKEIEMSLALMEAFSQLGESDGPSENDVYFETKDPDDRLMSLKVVDKDGNDLPNSGTSTSGADNKKLWKIAQREKIPADAALQLNVRTSKSTVTQSFDLKEVALP
jgi:hypothetical protein